MFAYNPNVFMFNIIFYFIRITGKHIAKFKLLSSPETGINEIIIANVSNTAQLCDNSNYCMNPLLIYLLLCTCSSTQLVKVVLDLSLCPQEGLITINCGHIHIYIQCSSFLMGGGQIANRKAEMELIKCQRHF